MPTPFVLEQTRPTGHGRARGLVSSRRSGQRVHAQTYRPSPDLRSVIEVYWTGRWDLRNQAPHTTEMLGDPCVHIVFERGPTGSSSRVVGVWTRLWRRTLSDQGHVRGVKIKAGALRAFFDLPAIELANRIAPLREFFPGVEDHEAPILDPEPDEPGFAALDAWLRTVVDTTPCPAIADATALVQRIARDTNLTTTAQLAEIAGYPLRSLQRLFREHVGASPKWVIVRNRLQEVALRVERGDAPNLARLAADLGYADQAHLARDFKRVVGKTPTEFASAVRG